LIDLCVALLPADQARRQLIPPSPGRQEPRSAPQPSKALVGFTAQQASCKVTANDGKGFINSDEPFVYHLKMGRYSDPHNHLLQMRKIRLLLLMMWMVLFLPIAAYGQWATSRIEHDWRVSIGGSSFGATQEFLSTYSTTLGTRTTVIYLGRYTIRTGLPAGWVAVLAVSFFGTACVFLITKVLRAKEP